MPESHFMRRSCPQQGVWLIWQGEQPLALRPGTVNEAAADLLQRHGLRSALFISAHQPGGQWLTPDENRACHRQLQATVSPWPVLAGYRVSEQGAHPPEEGVLVLCDDEALQRQWQRRFEQVVTLCLSASGEVELREDRSCQRAGVWPLVPEGHERPVSVPTRLVAPFRGFPPHQRLCFYPSCGHHLLWAVMNLDADLFVLSDHNRHYSSWSRIEADFVRHQRPIQRLEQGPDHMVFASGRQTAVLLWEDNQRALDRLRQAGLRIHHLVGIGDGCHEGSNRSCVHDLPFVGQVAQLAADGMRYITDHSAALQGAGLCQDTPGSAGFVDRLRLSPFPLHGPTESPTDGPLEAALPEVEFQLLGLLIRPDVRHDPQRLDVLPQHPAHPTQLDHLRPFRTLAGRGVLAEYRVVCAQSIQYGIHGASAPRHAHPIPHEVRPHR